MNTDSILDSWIYVYLVKYFFVTYTFDWEEIKKGKFGVVFTYGTWLAILCAVVWHLRSDYTRETQLNAELEEIKKESRNCINENIELNKQLSLKSSEECIEVIKRCYPDILVSTIVNEMSKK